MVHTEFSLNPILNQRPIQPKHIKLHIQQDIIPLYNLFHPVCIQIVG